MERCESERSLDAAGPGAVEGAVAAAMEGGVTMDEIVARIRARDSEDGGAAHVDGLIGVRQEAGRFAEEWERDREPGAEEGSARVAIETLQALALHTMAGLSQREDPMSTVELGHLSLTLQRIEDADRFRIEREQAVAGVGLSHGGEDQRSGWSIAGDPLEWPQRVVEEASDSEWAEDPASDFAATPPEPAPDAPFDDGRPQEATDQENANVTEDASDAGEAPDERDTGVPQDVRAVPDAPDDDAYSVARDVELRRRDRERLLWPTDPPFCPALWHTFG